MLSGDDVIGKRYGIFTKLNPYRRCIMRRALTLLELIIALAILGFLIALLLPAIQKIRIAALRSHSCNNLRQLGLAFHMLAGDNDGKIDKLPERTYMKFGGSGVSMFKQMLSRLDINRQMPTDSATLDVQRNYWDPHVPAFLSPADPTININLRVYEDPDPRIMHRISYVANLTAMEKTLLFPVQIQDGTASTILFAEKYWINSMPYQGRESRAWMDWQTYPPAYDGINAFTTSSRRATFADVGSWDDTPVSDGAGFSKRKVNSPPGYGIPPNGKAFDVQPLYTNTWCNRLQTPHPAGLPVALFDGSVRTLNPNIDERTFWSLVTPAGGEVVGDY